MARALTKSDSVGSQQFGRFHLRELLNSGGMSEIWLVSDERGKPYALRFLKRDLRFNFTARRRFMRGCDILSQLTESDHIVGYVEHGKAEGTCYLLMDYVEAENLKELYARQDALLKENVAQILIDAATGLSDVHESGYMHLDFKPENILVTRNAAVRLIDFDMAQPIPEKPVKFSKNPGTPGYMAPEQLRGEDVDGRTDLYAAGALLFELLTGRVAFEADSDYSLMMQQLNEPPAAPSSITAGVPRALDAVVARAMAKKPAQRFATASDFARALDNISHDAFSAEPIRGAAAAVVARAPRDWRVYVIGGCLLAAVGLGAAVVLREPVPAAGTGAEGATDSTGVADSAGAVARQNASPVGRDTASKLPARIALGTGVHEVPIESGASPAPSPAPRTTTQPGGSATPVRTRQTAPREPTTPQAPATPVRTEDVAPTTPAKVEPTRDPDAGVSVSRRLQDLAERCVSSIASNNAGRASSLLHGDTGGLMSAINDGRIVSASAGGVDVDAGDARGEGRFTVRIAWRTAFGGNKTAIARLSAGVSRAGDTWRSLGCTVESGGGVR